MATFEVNAKLFWSQINGDRDKRYGIGKWHCDDLLDAEALDPLVAEFVKAARDPTQRVRPALFATHCGERVRIVMASRLGDVGFTRDLSASSGYTDRVLLPDLTDFGDTP